ncbi:hypothetical protein FF38_02711 [Lucilia cuprina]|uniref:PR domain zinc finger protein 5 n=1 Tax=Lucilia cuprina TaxID=7375 RepID=A0A0L0CKC0_LUCCU|nr:hypothetical protein FF38_02711 [Lucilia cuprina]
MSKSNADFSAFDFNDSSDNSDVETRGPFLSRVALGNSSKSLAVNSNNINNANNNNNLSSGHHNTNQQQQQQQQQLNNSSHLSSSASNSSASSSEDEGETNDDNIVTTTAEQQQRQHQQQQQQILLQQQRQRQQQLHEAINGTSINEHLHDDDNNSNSSTSSSNSSSSTAPRGSTARGGIGVGGVGNVGNSSCINNTQQHQQNASGSNAQQSHNSDVLLMAAMGASSGPTATTTTIAANGLTDDSIVATSVGSNNNMDGMDARDGGNAGDGEGLASGLTESNTTNHNNTNSSNNNINNNSSCNVNSLLDSALAGGGGINSHIQNNGHSNASSHCNELVRSSSSASLSNASLNHHTSMGGGGGGGSGSIVGGRSNDGGGGGGNGGGGGGSLCGVPSSASSYALSAAERKKYRHQNFSKNIYIGTKNAEKWEYMRTRLHFKNDVEFVAYLLNLADNDGDRLANLPPPSASTTPTKSFDSNFKLEPNLSAKEFGSNSQTGENGGAVSCGGGGGDSQPPPVKRKYKKRVQFNDNLNGLAKLKNFSNFALKAKKHLAGDGGSGGGTAAGSANGSVVGDNNVSATGDVLPEVLDCRIAEKIKSEMEEKSASKESLALCLKKNDGFGDDEDDDEDDAGTSVTGDGVDGLNGPNSGFRMRHKNKRGPKTMNPPGSYIDDDEDIGDVSEDDEEDEELDEEALAREMKNEQNFVEEEDELDIAFRSHQSCRECSLAHDYKVCPLRTSIGTITDAVDLAEWVERKNLEALAKLKCDAQRQAKQLHGDDDEDMDDSSQLSDLELKPLITFAEASVPAEFELHNVEPNVTGVFARTEVRAFTKLGPLIGQSVQANDIREASDMKWIFEICEAGAEKSQFLMCDNPNSSNWLRYIRPAPTYDERNVNLVFIESRAFFVTCRDLKNGMELLYWSDDCNTMWRKKHWSEKTNCGGCNLKFDHPLYYRTHCSVFHDPTMSLTIRKYHCKVCGEAVLGKDNIMKHAAEKHDGKGAHQCQFCNKFFLRLSYLEMHRTYGCAANPNRTRPICDFCGRKYYRPQKLKAHIKRMHSDVADVLRDFQCNLCSKLLGSRAALQRHAKEVHSRNSTVVSCPRCQKLFQNRSNLKIHMLTHSGVRPFKCSESECNAAFTTKQCLQFHYKKVHNYSQEQMPKIERSVAYTFDAYSGGMKVDFLEQAPRRRRKSLEDQNSVMSSSIQSDAEFSDDNIFEAIKKSGKSIKDLCRNEPNLSLLSSKISSIFGEKPPPRKRGRKPKDYHLMEQQEQEHMEQMRRKQNAQLSLVESFLTTTAQRLTAQQQVQQVVAAAAAVSAMTGATADDPTSKMHMMTGLNTQHMGMGHHHQSTMGHDEDDEEDDDEEEDHGHHGHHGGQQMTHDNNGYRHNPGMNAMGQNLVVSKGSKKWISDDDRHLSRDCAVAEMGGGTGMTTNQNSCGMSGGGNNDMALPPFAVPQSNNDDPTKLMGSNRDFLSRLINSANPSHNHHTGNTREEDENSSFLDVVESNNAAANGQMSQYHHNSGNNAGAGAAANTGNAVTNPNNGLSAANGSANNQGENSQMSMNSLSQSQAFMSSFYNNANARLSGTGTGSSSSASMLVEAALNSVGNMIDNDNNDLKVPTENNINTDSPMSSHVDSETNRFNASNPMDNLESELKMMKNLNNFPMQIPPLPMFPNQGNNLNSCNISPSASTPTNPRSNQNNEVEVDAGSTPRAQHMGNAGNNDGDPFPSAAQHRTPPSPQPISPGRDYSMFGNNPGSNGGTPGGPGTAGSNSSANSTGGNSSNNNISASSPLPAALAQNQRRNASSVGSSYPEHELISPASSPSIPRYNFNNGDVMRHKHRSDSENDRRQALTGGHNHLSSDEENSIMPQNSVGQDMRMKFPQSQMDLMYSKYESLANSTALKYNNQNIDSPTEYRTSNSTATASSNNDISDLQGLDMSSRSNVSSSNYHHNFQLPSNSSANLPGIGRYHHHIYDILSEREQNQQSQSQSQQQHHSSSSGGSGSGSQHQQQEHPSQLSMQQHQSAMHSMLSDQLSEQEHDQATSVDLSRTANYVVPSPPQLPYNHPHHDMLRMASLDLTPNTNMSVGNNRSFLSSQMQHQSRESLEHHRLLSTVEQHRILAASNAAAADQHRLLVDPTAHLLMEQNNRLLGSDQSRLLGETAQNRHMARGFGAYHQVASSNYHPGVRPPVLPSANHHASNPSNYHPFPAYY